MLCGTRLHHELQQHTSASVLTCPLTVCSRTHTRKSATLIIDFAICNLLKKKDLTT
jgi:hypothetical protein